MIKNVITIVLLNLFQLNIHANIWTDPKTNVNYEYFVGKNTAEVKAGQPSKGFELSKPGSPLAAGEISILSKILVNGKEYTVTTIGSDAFAYCDKLTSVTIPESVQSIEEGSFEGCKNLSHIVIPEGITKIGRSAFMGCSSLVITRLPNSIKTIEPLTFSNCYSLQTVVIPEGVTEIGHSSFARCKNLSSVTISSSVKNIEGFAFGNCTNLKEVHLAEGLSTIGGAAFQGCKELSSIIIPSSIISIGELAFRGCNTLSIVISLIQNPFECSWNSFGGGERIATLKVPKGCVAKYKQTKAWNEFSNIVEIE